MSIYVETEIRASLDALWRATQTPDQHARWDLRFTDIAYLPRPDETRPQQFRYATRLGFGLAIEGQGETVGERHGPGGEQSSSLRFWSDDPRSLIRDGAGYWRYVPTQGGVRFLTSYDYRVRFGALGRFFDSLVFRPLIGWATAWSFDRLRLWIEKGIDPALSLQRSLVHALARCALALVWLYQGLVPKLLALHGDEIALIHHGGVPLTSAPAIVWAGGVLEVVFGGMMLLGFRQRWHFPLTMILLFAATLYAAITSPEYLVAAFNPVSLNLLMIVLALVGWLTSRDLPSARCCLRKPPRR
jgi:uncharacterized membrane protein YphA (DoxX/SURF4 family)